MPTIPSQHVVGDLGHTSDHNAIVDVLTDHEQRLVSQASSISGAMVKAGSNIINVANPAGWFKRIDIPAGTRDSSVWVEQVTYGGKRTFGLDTYGQARLDASTAAQVPLIVSGYSAAHATDILQWRKYEGGSTLGRVDQNGNIYAPNITPGTWTNITLASGIAWYGSGTARPQYRITGDLVELRGLLKKTNNTDFTATNPIDLCTLPSVAAPVYTHYFTTATQLSGGYGAVRIEAFASGLIRFYRWSESHTPNWVALDGIIFSRTATA